MSNEVTTPRGADVLADVRGFEGFAEALGTAKTDRATVTGAMPLLRMGTDGVWVYGAENVEVQPDALWVLDPRSIQRGYVCWTRWSREQLRAGKRNKLLGEVFVPLNAHRPDETRLPTHINEDTGEPWEWADAMAAVLICQSGVDRGLQVLYKTSSVGGLRALNTFLDDIEDQLNNANGEIVPELALDCDHYDHRDYGKTYVPVFDVVEWRAPGPNCGLTDFGLIEYGHVEKVKDQPKDEPAPRATRTRTRPAA